jgi:NAD(P)-dependent dehydrogenase (short-subunit alcohol dehydrogenase family)
MVRIAALELAPRQVRINVVHPDAVFDTGLWTPEVLERSAGRYGVSVEEYTTGAQVPVDGGHVRVI